MGERDGGVCWHRPVMRRVISLLKDYSVLLLGGRSLGKSAALSGIEAALEAGKEAPLTLAADGIVQGANPDHAAVFGSDAAHPVGSGVLLVDDIDVLLTPGPNDRPDAMYRRLDALRVFRGKPGNRLLLSASLTSATLEEIERSLLSQHTASERLAWGQYMSSASKFLVQCEKQDLAPWYAGWELDFSDLFTKWCEERFAESKPRPDARDAEKLAKLWRDAIGEMTGRHPALAGAAIRFLEELLNDPPSDADPRESGPRTHPPYLRRLVETCPEHVSALQTAIADYLCAPRGALDRLRGVLRSWRMEASPTDRSALESIRRVAQEGRDGIEPETVAREARGLLRQSGLCYADPNTGRLIVPGELLRREIVGGQVNEEIELIEVGSSSGALRAFIGGQQVQAELSGNPWKVLRFLFDRRHENRYWPAAELGERTGGRSERAAQSDLLRLQQELKKAELSQFIVNRRGEGYRFILPAGATLR
ncbi:MAG: hypothetical protein H6509_02865 [Bryobacterales bacterium]|nr:hypothetical protein [Bryobacterales bacterium]